MPNSVNHRKVYWTCGRIIFGDINLFFFFYLLIFSFFFPAVKSKPVLVTSREECEQVESSKKPWIWLLCPGRLSSNWRNIEACQTSDKKYSPKVWDKRERGRRAVIRKREFGKSLGMRPWILLPEGPQKEILRSPRAGGKNAGNILGMLEQQNDPWARRLVQKRPELTDGNKRTWTSQWQIPESWCLDTPTWTEGFPGDSVVKNLPASGGDMGLTPESGRSPGEGNGNPLQYSCLENPLDRGV